MFGDVGLRPETTMLALRRRETDGHVGRGRNKRGGAHHGERECLQGYAERTGRQRVTENDDATGGTQEASEF